MIVLTYENVKLKDIYLMVDCYNLIVTNATMVRSLALVKSCSGLFPFVPTFLSCPRSFRAHVPFFQISYYYRIIFVCFFLLLHPCCFYARSILCMIHIRCMGSPFPILHVEWSFVFWSFLIMRER